MKRVLASTVALLLVVGASSLFLRASSVVVPSGTWAPTGDLNGIRAGAAAVLLSDGVVFVTGGSGADGRVASAERYSVSGGTFIATESMQAARANHTATVLSDGRVLVVGGFGADGAAASTAEIYNPATNVWMSAGSLAHARAGHTATLLPDGRVLVAGGENGEGALATLEVYSPVFEQFSLVGAPMTSKRMRHAAALAGKKVLITGGWDGAAALASVDVFDPENDSVAAGPSMSSARAEHTATTLLSGNVLVAGGMAAGGDLQSAEVFDVAAGGFVPAASMADARRNHIAILLPHNNSVLIAGGWSGGAASATAELYRAWQDGGIFVSTGSSLAPRNWSAGGALSFAASATNRGGPADGLVLVAGGDGASSAELYGFATVKTDKDDYQPGDVVYVSGSGWLPNQLVSFYVRELPAEHYARLVTINADGGGNINGAKLFDVEEHHLGVRFLLTAADGVSQAHMTFTDGAIRVRARIDGTNTNLVVNFAANAARSFASSNCTGVALASSGAFTTSADGNGYQNAGMNVSSGSVSVDAPSPVTVGTTTYNFSNWNADGGATLSSTTGSTGCFNGLGNGQTSFTANYVAVTDSTAPTVTIDQAAGQADPTSTSPINFTVIFSEPVSDFITGDVTLSGTAGATTATVSGSGTTYNVAVGGMTGNGTVIASIAAGAATDAALNANTASNSTDNTVNYDATGPTVTIDQAAGQVDPTGTSPINFTVVFSEAVSNFATGDVTLSGTAGATTGTVTGSGTTYNVAVSGMTGGGTVIASIAGGVATDGAGNANIASTSADNTVTYDVTPPTVTIDQATGQADPTNASPINFTVVFSEPVSNFSTGDVTLTGTAGATTATVTGSGTTYNVAVGAMANDGTVIASITANVATDAAGNSNTASTSTDNTVTYDATPPTVTIDQATGQADPTNGSPINFTVVFSEPVSNFATGDVMLSGTAGATTATVTGSGTTYNVAVNGMTGDGTVIASIAANVATDPAGNPNTASTSADNTVTYDVTPPTATIDQASGQADPTNSASINFTVVFSEPVGNFATGDVTLNGNAGATTATVTGSGTTYNVAVTGMTGDGTVIASIAANVATDAAGNPNTASTSTDSTVTYDITPPTVTSDQAIGQADPTNSASINFTVVFSEPVSNFATGDVTLSGTAGATTATVTGSGTTYNVAVTGMTTDGTVTTSIAAGAATDAAGNANTASTSTDNTVTYDATPPTVTIDQASGQADPTNASPINFTVFFSEPVSNFATGDVTLTGTAGATTATVTGSGTTYNVSVSGMTANGTVIASIPAGAATDLAGNANVPSTSTDNTVTFDTVPPTVMLSSMVVSPTNAATWMVTAQFSEPVSGFVVGDVTVGNGTASTFAMVDADTYTFNVTATAQGTVTVNVAAGVAMDAATNGNTAAAQLSWIYDATPPTVTNTTASPNPVAVGTNTTITANVSDAATGNSKIVSADYSLDGGLTWAGPMGASDGSFNSPTENVIKTLPLATGVYNVCVRGTDAAGNVSVINAANSANACTLLAVYDPTAGFVTGGGWINSPAGAYTQDPTLIGRANFGFVSKFQRGRNNVDELTGQTQFQFQAGNLNFHSTAYQWLVVSGARAQFKGTGTINGVGGYEFLLTGIDGQVVGGGGIDRFRIKITLNGSVVYDNQLGSGDTEDLINPGTIVQGSIVIHSAKK